MNRSTTMEELAGRFEAASEPSFDLFAEAFEAIHGTRSGMGLVWSNFCALIEADAWLDAAMTLVPEEYAYSVGNINPSRCRCNAWVMPPPFNFGADIRTGATPALALCAAALRAQNKDEAHGE